MEKRQTSKFPSERDPIVSGLRPVGEIVAYLLAELKRKQKDYIFPTNKQNKT